MHYILKEDALSFKMEKGANRVYGKKGDKVSKISDCDNVVIVEGKNGDRFPVPKEILRQING